MQYKKKASKLHNQTSSENKHFVAAVIVFTLAASFYLYEFILQVSPAVMTAGMMRDFHVHAAGLGIISAAYFYSYAPMQIPAGMLYDRYGPRMLMTIAVLLCAIGCVFFGVTESRWFAAVGRIFMGVGSAFSFIGTLILISRWFPANQFALLVGIAQALSSVGAIIGEYPLAYSVDHVGWRDTMFVLAVVGLLLAVIIWFMVRDYPPDVEPEDTSNVDTEHEISKLIHVCRNPQTWYIGMYTFFVWAPIVVFAGLWGVPFLANVYGINDQIAALYVSMIWFGIGVGSTTLGWWTDIINNRTKPMRIAALVGVISMSVLCVMPKLPITMLLAVLFGIGFASGGQSVSFAVVKDINFNDHLGTASGFNNMATVAGGVCIQPLVGVFLDLMWAGDYVKDVPYYSIGMYQIAFIVLPICYIFAWMMSCFFIKETNCQFSPRQQQ